MYTASDLRKGLKLQIDGNPFIIIDFEFSKPGKGQALYRCKMRNMITGNQFVQTYRSVDKFEQGLPLKSGRCSTCTTGKMNTISWTLKITNSFSLPRTSG